MEEKDIQLLDDYFNDLLQEEEREAVLARTANDAAFAEEFQLRLDMANWPRRNAGRRALAENLESVGAAFFDASAGTQPALKATVNWRRWMLAAAAVVLLGVAVWFLSAPEPSLYRQYAQYAPPGFTERGAAGSAANAAETAFNAGRYAEALTEIDRMLAAGPADPGALLYKGICLLELNRPAEARAVLEPLSQGRSALRAEAAWFYALSFLLENNLTACKTSLQQLSPGEDHYEDAQKLLNQIE